MFVDHIFARPAGIPPLPPGLLYQYVVAANGVFVRAWRPGLSALIPVAPVACPIRGLAPITPCVHVDAAVPLKLTARMFELAYRAGSREILFYLTGGTRTPDHPWQLHVPAQEQRPASVRPVDAYAGGPDTLIEVHSHHRMPAFFSPTDDAEERAGFRIYAVIGGFGRPRPQLRLRVGIYGHFFPVPPAAVFALPPDDRIDVSLEQYP